MRTKEQILYDRMVTRADSFHDENGFECQMRDGYGNQIYEAMQEYLDQGLATYKEKLKVNVRVRIESNPSSHLLTRSEISDLIDTTEI